MKSEQNKFVISVNKETKRVWPVTFKVAMKKSVVISEDRESRRSFYVR